MKFGSFVLSVIVLLIVTKERVHKDGQTKYYLSKSGMTLYGTYKQYVRMS